MSKIAALEHTVDDQRAFITQLTREISTLKTAGATGVVIDPEKTKSIGGKIFKLVETGKNAGKYRTPKPELIRNQGEKDWKQWTVL